MTDPRDNPSPFGVLDFLPWDHDWNHHHYEGSKTERAVTLMREAGVGCVRMDFLWADLEPEQGRFDFAKYDRLVDLLRGQGLSIIGVLQYNPSWRPGPLTQPPITDLYVHYAEAVVQRYKDRVRHWQIWNEPDHDEYWKPQDNLVSYLRLLKTVYPALKRVDPESRIHLGGLSKALPNSLKNIYEGGGRDFFDIADIHLFINPLMPDAVGGAEYLYQTVRKTMACFGDEKKPVWFTEFGCPGMRDPKSAPEWWLGKNPTETVQAEWVRAAYVKAARWPGVEKVFWAFFRDTDGHFKTGVDSFGLVRGDFSLKPAYETYRQLALDNKR